MTEHHREIYQGWGCANSKDRSLDYSSCYGKTECWKVKLSMVMLSGAVRKVFSLIHVTFACIETRDPFLII